MIYFYASKQEDVIQKDSEGYITASTVSFRKSETIIFRSREEAEKYCKNFPKILTEIYPISPDDIHDKDLNQKYTEFPSTFFCLTCRNICDKCDEYDMLKCFHGISHIFFDNKRDSEIFEEKCKPFVWSKVSEHTP